LVIDEDALLELLRLLRSRNYRFTTVTPATHARVLSRPVNGSPDLRDIFGWNRPFHPGELERDLLNALESANALQALPIGGLKSRVRFASLGDDLFAHSAFPTDEPDSVFFGPDTYRFVRFIERQLRGVAEVSKVVDMGAGAGAGGVAVARRVPESTVTLVDINPRALALARANARAAGVAVDLLHSDHMPAGADLVIANPPYMMDRLARSYRDGGALLGGAVALQWLRQALDVAAPGATILLYTGAAFVGGHSPLLAALDHECRSARAGITVEEIDPDVFGEELAEPAYRDVERIAAVGITVHKRP
jgi:methylase of polypeptide subunit release factors